MNIYHIHHIVPKHMGGTNDPFNLIKLTVEEHALAHKKLWEEHGMTEDYLAWKGLSGQISSSEVVRLALIAASHKRARLYSGIPLTPEHRQKISNSKIGKPRKTTAAGRHRCAQANRLRQQKRWKVTSPRGIETEIVNLKEYCTLHNLGYSNLQHSKKWKGWTCSPY